MESHMSRIPPHRWLILFGVAVLVVSGASLAAGERLRGVLPNLRELTAIAELAPMAALPRTELFLASEEARQLLAADRPWAAWTVVSPHLDAMSPLPASVAMIAARAAAGWNAWDHVGAVLRPQLEAGALTAEGWMLLGRAEAEQGRWDRAAYAYERAAGLGTGATRGLAHARHGLTLRQLGHDEEAGRAFGRAGADLPEVADWLFVLQEEALLGGSPEQIRSLAGTTLDASPAVRLRSTRAEAAAWTAAGGHDEALARVDREWAVLFTEGARHEAGMLTLERAHVLNAGGRTEEARDLMRAVSAEPRYPGEVRAAAADLLAELAPSRTLAEEIARASAYEAASRHAAAVRALRASLERGAADTPELRERLGRALYEARDYGPARVSLEMAAAGTGDRVRAAELAVLAARSRFRQGDRTGGLTDLRRAVQERAGTPAVGTALFLLGDATDNLREAISFYRQASQVRGAPEAREAHFRLGDRLIRSGDAAAGLQAWDAYLELYPTGEQSAQVAFLAAREHERAGRQARARDLYARAVVAEPLAYDAVRAGQKIGRDPLDRYFDRPVRWEGTRDDAPDVARLFSRIDLLESAGLRDEARAELEAELRRFEARPFARLLVAEALAERARVPEAVRLARQLADQRGDWDVRLLRAAFPLPYGELMARETRAARVDLALFAGLVRQESMFRSDVRSRVGATGLSQIMPATGRWLAPGAGIRPYEERLLTVPEVNVRMGARYLGDMLRRYGGAEDLALAAYNAGPGRADRWRGELGHARDQDSFRERIPFDETRHYVRVVLRNAAVYGRLYPDGPRSAAAE
jgi:soluble lytic murein transglycosylase